MKNHSPKTCQALWKSRQNFLCCQEPIMLVYSRYSLITTSSCLHGTICKINMTDRYGLCISHFSLLEISIIIQKLLLQVIFVLLLVFDIGQNYGATLSFRTYRQRAQDSKVKVVSLLKCRSLSKGAPKTLR